MGRSRHLRPAPRVGARTPRVRGRRECGWHLACNAAPAKTATSTFTEEMVMTLDRRRWLRAIVNLRSVSRAKPVHVMLASIVAFGLLVACPALADWPALGREIS